MGCLGYFGPGRPVLRMPPLEEGEEEMKQALLRGEIREVKMLKPGKDGDGGRRRERGVKEVAEEVLRRLGVK